MPAECLRREGWTMLMLGQILAAYISGATAAPEGAKAKHPIMEELLHVFVRHGCACSVRATLCKFDWLLELSVLCLAAARASHISIQRQSSC